MKRALIIGSQTLGLSGVHNDIDAMVSCLEQRSFSLDIRKDADASREGILAGLERLLRDSGPEDAALIYYSGHGARIRNPRHGPDRRHEPPLLHSLVPTDWTSTKFRGLLDLELSLRLADLTDKTRNVAVILDCCHAARMWRGMGEAVSRSLDRVWVDDIDEQLTELRELDLAKLHAESNPDAVRLVATEADRSAFEMPLSHAGELRQMGLMTAMLVAVLDELGSAQVSWRTLGLLVRERVMQRYDYQRPEVEGPGQRHVFKLGSAGYAGSVAYFLDHGRPALRASRLLGAEPGARYAIMPAGVSEYDEAKTVAEAKVTQTVGTSARVELALRHNAVEPSVGALAFPLELPLGKQLVRIRGTGPSTDALRKLIVDSVFVAVADEHDAAILTVDVGKRLQLFADSGAALAVPEQSTDNGRRRILADLERWARAELLRNLRNGELRADYELEWGRIVGGERIPMTTGEPLHVEDRIYIEFKNCGPTPLLFAAFDIGVDGAVTLLTAAEPSGTKVEPGQSYVLGLALGSDGLPVSWPEHVPKHIPLPESLVIIVSEGRHDFAAFEIEGRRGRTVDRSRSSRTALERALDQIGTAATRNVAAESRSASADYTVRRFDFLTDPQRRVTFAVEQPTGRALLERALEQRGEPLASKELAIRLNELEVHRNRAIWGSSDIRIDTLCITGGKPVTATYVFPGIGDEDRLPFDNLPIFRGTATGFIDFAIWVSKHDDGKPKLPDLLREVTGDPEFAQAATVLAGLVAAGPQTAALAPALAAGGTVTYFVNRLIERLVGKHIGLYRTSFLPLENWGLGRHPEQGSIRAQDFSFNFELLAL